MLLRARSFAVVVLTSVLVVACGGASSSRQPLAPVQISKAEPPASCQLIGAVTGSGWGVEEAYSELRQEARHKQANYVVLDGVAGGVFGRAFRCPTQAAPATAPPPPAAATTCEPDCSPGYACVRGSCVSACNPPCEKGQRCDAERTCKAAP